MAVDDRFERAVAAIDAANADDPNMIMIDGRLRPKEQAHAELMSRWVERLDPGATDAQRLAARAHHLRRWSISRASYPEGRAGYLRWRTALSKQHAHEVAALLLAAGYDETAVAGVQAIIRKERLGKPGAPPAIQVHEDALCLVFLETQLADLVDRLGADKSTEVIRKTAGKMSKEGLAQVAELDLRDSDRDLLAVALGA